MLTFHIFANAALGKGLSGSDRIFIEFARRLSKKYPVTIHVWKEGYWMCLRQNLQPDKRLKFDVLDMGFWCKAGFVVCYLARIIAAVLDILFVNIENKKSTIVYSASEFWMDCLPAFILKIRFPKVRWIAAWFQTAPKPWTGFAWAFPYWFVQLPIKPLIKKFADFVLVNNEQERNQFPQLNKEGKVIVILGAVDIEAVKKFQKLYAKRYPLNTKKYDACFQGRFHPQKGVVEMVEIWKKVVEKIPSAKLALIGDGPLMRNVKLKIKNEKLEKNIKLFGWVFDGPQKYEIFSQSKLVVHPAFFDSGGMASAEAMAFGLPCIGFNLSSYRSYYPEGMIKVAVGDLRRFADKIIELIGNKKRRDRVGKEAQKMVSENWSWDQRVNLLMPVLKRST